MNAPKLFLLGFVMVFSSTVFSKTQNNRLPHGLMLLYTSGGSPYISHVDGRQLTDTVFQAFAVDSDYPLIWLKQSPEIKSDADTYLFCNNGWALMDTGGFFLSHPVYDYPVQFEDGIAICSRNGLLGSIDSNANTLLPFVFEDIQPLQYGFYAVKKHGRIGIARRNGQYIWEPDAVRVSAFVGSQLILEDSAGNMTLLDSNGSFTRNVFRVARMMQVPVSKLLSLSDGENENSGPGIEVEGLSQLSKLKNSRSYIQAENLLMEMGMLALLEEQACQRVYPLNPNINLYLHQRYRNSEARFAPPARYAEDFVCCEREYTVEYAGQFRFCLREYVCLDTFNLFEGTERSLCSYRFYNYSAWPDTCKPVQLKALFKPGYETDLQMLLKNAVKKTGLDAAAQQQWIKQADYWTERCAIQKDGIRFYLTEPFDAALSESEDMPEISSMFLSAAALQHILIKPLTEQ